jgi:hypothetical protein
MSIFITIPLCFRDNSTPKEKHKLNDPDHGKIPFHFGTLIYWDIYLKGKKNHIYYRESWRGFLLLFHSPNFD